VGKRIRVRARVRGGGRMYMRFCEVGEKHVRVRVRVTTRVRTAVIVCGSSPTAFINPPPSPPLPSSLHNHRLVIPS